MKRPFALLTVLAAFAVGCGDDDESPGSQGEDARLGAVIKGLDNPFFVTMRDGLVATARRLGVPLRVEAASGIQDPAGQAQALDSMVVERRDCYVLNPIDATNLLSPLERVPAGAPVVNVDSFVDRDAARSIGVEIATYIGTDNLAAGRAGADAMAELVDPGASVALVTGVPGDIGSDARARGFREGARGRFVVTSSVAADFDRDQARLAAEALLRSDPKLQGVFAVNDEMALGIAETVNARRRPGAVVVIGMDGTREALAAISRGEIAATVSQYPYAMGQLAIEACLARLNGEQVPDRIDAPVQVVTEDNVARARAAFPQPVEAFDDPLAGLLSD